MTRGRLNAATQVMRFSVYGVLDAFAIVRPNAGLLLAGMTFGNSADRIVATAKTIVTAIAANDRPSRPTALNSAEAMSATAAMTAKTMITRACGASRWASTVQARNVAATTMVG